MAKKKKEKVVEETTKETKVNEPKGDVTKIQKKMKIKPVVVEQTKEERDAKAPKTYLGNVKVVWTNGNNVDTAPRDGAPAKPVAPKVEEDLPF